ncbi:MAG TPA: site-2 protease family protein [Blastocatellia bacterium]|nr:site-2 protease family protein [Blastocatellia bacterium]
MESLLTIQIGDLIFYFIAFILSLSVHESAHALTSYWFGDDTGHLQGRISLNPMAHIDPIGTIVIPLIGFLSAAQGLPPLIGWAKPVETNPLRWRNKDVANISVSAAGPISNLLLALMFFIVMKFMILSGTVEPAYIRPFTFIRPMAGQPDWMLPLCTFLSLMLMVNVGLAIFNLIPIPPLDGSHVLETLLPDSLKDVYDRIRPFSLIILMGLLWIGVFGVILGPVRNLVISLLWGY